MYRRLSALLIILLLVAVALCVSSCNNEDVNDTDENTGGNEELDTQLYLPITVDSVSQLTIVSSYSKAQDYAAAYKSLISEFKDAGITFKTEYEASDDPELSQILIGDRINAAADFYIDPHTLGYEGYAIKVVGNKLIIAGGSSKALAEAISFFRCQVLKLDDPATDICNLSVTRSTDIFIKNDYPISEITVDGNDLSGYDIVCDTNNKELFECAKNLREVIYKNAGYWLNVRSESEKPTVHLRLSDYAGDEGFRAYVEGKNLIVECAYPALLGSSIQNFISDYFISVEKRAINFSKDEVYTQMISKIFYSDFGAVGDGIADDFAAIKAAHDAANKTGQTVVATAGKTYNLGVHDETIVIKTNVIWSGATFIIDDSGILPTDPQRNRDVFSVVSDRGSYSVSGISSLEKGQTNVGMTFDGPTLLRIVCSDFKQYIRYGANADDGSDQQEIILVDKNGNVDPNTPIMWDYPTLSSVTAFPADDKPITIRGGSFVTVANAAPREYTYYKRGISVRRSNLTFDGLLHSITGEGSTGAPYNGFISISYSNNVLIENTTFTGHKVYKLSSNVNNSMGTYDFSINSSNYVTLRNCNQTNDITDSAYWGVMGSNYCKNLTYDTCVFSRFDAHKGTHNATIINSQIGHQKLSIIGSGTLRVENTVVYGNSIAALRSDYGSTWEGDMIFKNVTLMNTGTVTLISGSWNNHYFGYTCYLPANVYIDGITLAKGDFFYILPNYRTDVKEDKVNGAENLNKLVITDRVTVRNVSASYTYCISNNPELYANTDIVNE